MILIHNFKYSVVPDDYVAKVRTFKPQSLIGPASPGDSLTVTDEIVRGRRYVNGFTGVDVVIGVHVAEDQVKHLGFVMDDIHRLHNNNKALEDQLSTYQSRLNLAGIRLAESKYEVDTLNRKLEAFKNAPLWRRIVWAFTVK